MFDGSHLMILLVGIFVGFCLAMFAMHFGAMSVAKGFKAAEEAKDEADPANWWKKSNTEDDEEEE